MGYVFATIGLANRWHVINDRHELVDDYEIRSIEVEMLVDTGSLYMCINESIRTYLNLEVIDKGKFQLADGMIGEYEIVGPVEVRFANRTCRVDAIVLPGNNQCLLGAIPMEAMDILISPTRQELVVNPAHPDYALFRL
ncbi:clan AA aspartic protease [Sediminibacterium roseum]|uniref:Clan AA aspartic protease n=1 Tax=Sediminibacterium roseum TaxID=1978412 RepID=A0ABW9ZND3_9BACT|nr:aspartyl protease family protein [Sediminibacterium roseum]NCI48584.1 clan AA aspartic protease [Sediminibacterium roseum]